jgi:hypothetical protein
MPEVGVAWIDHPSARVLQCGDGPAPARTIRAHTHDTVQHGTVRTQREFYGEGLSAVARP